MVRNATLSPVAHTSRASHGSRRTTRHTGRQLVADEGRSAIADPTESCARGCGAARKWLTGISLAIRNGKRSPGRGFRRAYRGSTTTTRRAPPAQRELGDHPKDHADRVAHRCPERPRNGLVTTRSRKRDRRWLEIHGGDNQIETTLSRVRLELAGAHGRCNSCLDVRRVRSATANISHTTAYRGGPTRRNGSAGHGSRVFPL